MTPFWRVEAAKRLANKGTTVSITYEGHFICFYLYAKNWEEGLILRFKGLKEPGKLEISV